MKDKLQTAQIYLLLAFAGSITCAVLPAKAQQDESFSSCVAEVDSRYGVSVDTAIEQCKLAFQNRAVNENYSTCVANLDDLYGVSASSATGHCSEVFQSSAQNSANSSSGSNAGTTIIINPEQNQSSPVQAPPTRASREVCVTPVGTYSISMNPCNLGVSGFTRKVVYE